MSPNSDSQSGQACDGGIMGQSSQGWEGKPWVCGGPRKYLIQVGGWSKKVSRKKQKQVRGETVEPGEDAGERFRRRKLHVPRS